MHGAMCLAVQHALIVMFVQAKIIILSARTILLITYVERSWEKHSLSQLACLQ